MPGTLTYSATAQLKQKDSVPGMAALVADATRQPRASWQGWYSTVATSWHYRAPEEVSNCVGCPAMGAKRHSVGRVTGTIALLAGSTFHRRPQGRGALPPARH